MRSSSLHRLIIHVSQTAAYSRSSEQFSIPASEKWGFVPFSPNHLLTYNISIQYVLVIHVHVTYRVCTSEVKTDEETKNHPLPLLRRNSNIKRCILCIWNAFSWRTGLCLLPLSILQFLCRGTSGNQDTKRNARQPGASSKADSGTSNFRSDLATGHPFQTGSISLGGR